MPFTAGPHQVNVASAMITKSSRGTPWIKIFFHNEDSGTIEHTLWVTPNTRDRVLEQLEMLGCSRAQLDDENTLGDLDEILTGAKCEIVCEEQEYNGKWSMKVKWINPAELPVGDDLISEMYGLLTGKQSTRKPELVPARPVAAAVPVGPVAEGVDDESVPF